MSSLINHKNEVILSGNNILKFLKFCLKYNLEINKINENIEFNIDANDYIEKENILSYTEIDKLNKYRNPIVIKLILHIYIIQLKEKEILNEIILKTNCQKEISKAILNLLKDKIIKPKDLFFLDNFDLEYFQLFLLKNVSKYDKINYIIKISQNIEKALEFISTNYIKIYEIFFSNYSNSYNNDLDNNIYNSDLYLQRKIDLNNVSIGDNLLYILELLKKIFALDNNNNYHLIDYERLFILLENKFFSKDIEIYYLLGNFISLTGKHINQEIIIQFYDKVHEKGMNMIKNNQMKDEKIFLFMANMDKYYYDPNFNKSDKKDPEIMKYIPLTDIDPNYLKNIEYMKKYKVINFFINSIMEKKFYNIILEKIKKILDFKFIFEIFTPKEINKNFLFMINGMIEKIKYTILDVSDEKYNDLFNIFDNLLLMNITNIRNIINALFLDLKLPTQYCIYLFNQKTEINELIIFRVLDDIIKINRQYPEQMINILLNSRDIFSKYIFEKINDLCIDENDFYHKEKSLKFILYSKFINKCQNLYNKFKNIKGIYKI